MLQLLQSKWTALVAGALAYGLTTWACLKPLQHLHRAAAAVQDVLASATTGLAGPSWTFHNPELSQLVSELQAEREAVAARAKALDALQARLAAERQEIYTATQAVQRLRTEFDSVVTRVSEQEAVNLKKLTRVYASMSPDGASRILKQMTDEQVVKLLALMKEDESAPILENLGQGSVEDAKRAAMISNRLRLTLVPPKKPTL